MTQNPSIDIAITSIPHKLQRYDTCGDYNEVLGVTFFRISKLPDRREMFLVMIHEVIEWALCQTAGISNQKIDDFDLSYDNRAAEPGDASDSPYYRQHQIATGIERILAAEMGVDWNLYTNHVEELSK